MHRLPRKILDIGTGTGAISIALAHAFPSSMIVATDISAQALACAQQNIEACHTAKGIVLVRMDMCKGLDTTFDLIVSNPPYIPCSRLLSLPKSVKYYEPLTALNGGKRGTMFTKVMIKCCTPIINEHGCMAIEIDEEAVDDLAEFLAASIHMRYTFINDQFQKNRYLFLEKKM